MLKVKLIGIQYKHFSKYEYHYSFKEIIMNYIKVLLKVWIRDLVLSWMITSIVQNVINGHTIK